MIDANTDEARRLLGVLRDDGWWTAPIAVEQQSADCFKVYWPDFRNPAAQARRPYGKSQDEIQAEFTAENRKREYVAKFARETLGRTVRILIDRVRKDEVEHAAV